jgi:hypothetical protein
LGLEILARKIASCAVGYSKGYPTHSSIRKIRTNALLCLLTQLHSWKNFLNIISALAYFHKKQSFFLSLLEVYIHVGF